MLLFWLGYWQRWWVGAGIVLLVAGLIVDRLQLGWVQHSVVQIQYSRIVWNRLYTQRASHAIIEHPNPVTLSQQKVATELDLHRVAVCPSQWQGISPLASRPRENTTWAQPEHPHCQNEKMPRNYHGGGSIVHKTFYFGSDSLTVRRGQGRRVDRTKKNLNGVRC